MTINFNKHWNREDDQILIKMVNDEGNSFEEIGKKLGRTTISCRSRSARLNLFSNYRKRFYTHNENFWLKPNFLNSYWAGFCAADASVKYRNQRGVSLRLEISTLDLNHLELFRKSIDSDVEIRFCNGKRKFFPNRNKFYDTNSTCYLSVNDTKTWRNDLAEKFGIIPNKTKRLKPPNLIDDTLKFCYIVGFTDGDGTITGDKTNKNSIFIRWTSSSIKIVEWIKEVLKPKFNYKIIDKGDSNVIKIGDYCYAYSLTGIRALQFINVVKDLPIPKLSRKWSQPRILTKLDEFKIKYPEAFQINSSVINSETKIDNKIVNSENFQYNDIESKNINNVNDNQNLIIC